MSYPLRKAVAVSVGLGALVLTFVAPAGAANVPVSQTLTAHLVTSSLPSQRAAGPVHQSLRVRNPAQYAADKAAANQRYNAWATGHPLATAFAPSLSTSIVSLNQPGLGAAEAGGSTPPDPTGAAGPNNYVEFVNSEIAVYNRSTLASPPVATATEDAFTHSSSTCDGQIKWDQAAQRFEYYSLDCAAAVGSEGFSFGWSKTSSPTPLTGASSNWCNYHVSTGAELYDYGKLGNSNAYMIIGANRFNDISGAYDASPIVAFPKPANGSTTCPSVSGTTFTPSTANEFTPEPANVFGSSNTGYVVAISGSLSNALRMYTVTTSTTSPFGPVLTDRGNISVPAFATPASVPQPAPAPSVDVLDSSDTRLTQANAVVDPALKTFGIWTQHTIAGPGGGPSVVRWYELKAGQSLPVQVGTVAGPSGEFAFNGAISPTKQGNAAAIDYNVGGSSNLVALMGQIHPIGAANGSMGSPAVLASSAAVDTDFSCPVVGGGRPCRWGDYAGASVDPSSYDAVFGTNMFNGPAAGGNAQWATENFRLLLPDELPTAAFTAAATPSPAPAHTESFNGSSSFDGTSKVYQDGHIVSWTWSFGDGSPAVTTTTATVQHTYAAAGSETVTLTVKDSDSQTSSVPQTITVG